MSSETPFQIAVPDEKLAKLRAKLDLVELPDELEDAGWEYGVPLVDMKRLVERWKNGYDWRAHEKALNEELPQFTRDIDIEGHGTLNIHYVHKRSTVDGALPLLFVHGWPGSFLEVRKIAPLLTENSSDSPSFHVVAFDLPGYGFSEGPSKKKFRKEQYAELGNKLMLALGYTEYVTQGGDWGYLVTRTIAQQYGGVNSKAWHTNITMSPMPKLHKNPLTFLQFLLTRCTPKDKASMERAMWFRKKGSGYFIEQSTQPQTLGYSLADSPVGLLAWIYEKLVNWTDKYPWTDDEVLTWISIYWFSRAGPAASIRLYYEVVQAAGGNLVDSLGAPPKIPMGVSFFPQEFENLPRKWVHLAGNVVFTSEQDKGGHFAAHEAPEELVSDLRKMFRKGGAAYGVVSGSDGYALTTRM